jgi:hypothetical protein
VLLELEQVLGALQHHHDRGQAAGHHTGLPMPATTGSAAATASSSSFSHLNQRGSRRCAVAVSLG